MANVVHFGIVHRLVGPGERTTVLSAHSLAARIGAIGAGLALGPVAEGAGISWAMAAAAAIVAAAAPLYLRAGAHGTPSTGAGRQAAVRR